MSFSYAKNLFIDTNDANDKEEEVISRQWYAGEGKRSRESQCRGSMDYFDVSFREHTHKQQLIYEERNATQVKFRTAKEKR